MKYWIFWFLWSVAALLGGGVFLYFMKGLLDGTVSSFNIILWLILLLAVATSVGGSWWLQKAGHPIIAMLPLLIPLTPAVLFAGYALLFIFGGGRMN